MSSLLFNISTLAVLSTILSLCSSEPLQKRKSGIEKVISNLKEDHIKEEVDDHIKEDVHDHIKKKHHAWDYFDPASWSESYPTCGGTSQSPIWLDESIAVESTEDTVEFNGYDSPLVMTLKNNGHTVKATIGANDYVTMSGEGLPGTFRAAQLHFHWGIDDSMGSEHHMADRVYPLEMHIVHVNTKYDLDTALQKKDGLAVLGVFFDADNSDNALDNEIIDPVIGSLKKVRDHNKEVKLEALTLFDLMPQDKTSFFRYNGSLTTPSCNEVVTWTVLKDVVSISSAQLEEFRQIIGSDFWFLVNNFRPVQPLNGRTVTST